MKISGKNIESSTEYELLHFSVKKRAKKAAMIYMLIIFITIVVEIVYYGYDLSRSIEFCVIMLRTAFITGFFIKSWHHNLQEGARKKLPFWWGILTIILLSFDLLASLLLIIPCLLLYFDTGIWLLMAYFDIVMLMLAVVPFLLYYCSNWLRIYRWTWEELQLSKQERKRICREKKLICREEKRESRRKNIQEKAKAIKEIVPRSKNEKPLKSQESRRAELENLKKLYEDGLIDEEDYKRAREKTLGIQ